MLIAIGGYYEKYTNVASEADSSRWQNQRLQKRIFLLFLFISLLTLFLLAGCNSNQSSSQEASRAGHPDAENGFESANGNGTECYQGETRDCACGYGQPDSKQTCNAGGNWRSCVCNQRQSSDDNLCRTSSRGVPDSVVLERHDPIILDSVESSADNPVIIEGYEITNPDGPCISILNVNHVIIRNNYLHHCGTNVSKAVQNAILAGGNESLAAQINLDETGAVHVFNAIDVEVYSNRIGNGDYGILLDAHDHSLENVSVHDNVVETTHRMGAIYVRDADAVLIENNCSRDSGLELFFNNEALAIAQDTGQEHAGDGRAWGIITHNCSHVTISGNTVINSSTDGIAVVADENSSRSEVFDIVDNIILRNGEQGIWIVGMNDGRINDNIIWENRARESEVGGSSGIILDIGSKDVDIFDNNLAYNDMFGIALQAASIATIHDNEIHHNGDGAIGWGDFHTKGSGFYTTVRDNNIHDNRFQVFGFMTKAMGTVIVDGNVITNNGGMPVHFEFFDDYNIISHPDVWIYDGPSEIFPLASEEQIEWFQFDINIIDGEEISGFPK